MQLRAILVAVLLVLAGCSGLGGPTDGTATNGTMGNDTTAGQQATSPTGVTADGGLENATALLAAQRAGLNGSSYVADFRSKATVQRNGEPVHQRTHSVERVASGGAPIRYSLNRSGPRGTQLVEIYGNETVGFSKQSVRSRMRNRTSYTRGVSATHLRSRMGANFIALFIQLGNYSTVSVSGTGESTEYTLDAASPNATIANRSKNEVLDYEGRLVLGSDGMIESANITTTINGTQQPIDYEVDYELRSVGEDVSVSRPAWYETALSETPAIGLDAAPGNGTAIELTNTGRDPIPAGRSIVFTQRGRTGGYVQLEQAIEPGQTVYVSRSGETGRFQLTRSVPDNGTRFQGTIGIRLTAGGQRGIVTAQTTVAFE